ncbi:hypothetical protein ABI59_17975 [Acidobacteria bacterium Mor1]|nr:hypothetical protein ABI59_17975 [Acidobacteria bacterium Mor1]
MAPQVPGFDEPSPTPRRRRRQRSTLRWLPRRLLRPFLVIAACLAVIFISVNWALRNQSRLDIQHRNTAVMDGYRKALEKHLEKSGAYPASLAELPPLRRNVWQGQDVDDWGETLHYESDSTRYVLVSYGSDFKPDGHDYWALRNGHAPDTPAEDICRDWPADQIASDLGWHRVCER